MGRVGVGRHRGGARGRAGAAAAAAGAGAGARGAAQEAAREAARAATRAGRDGGLAGREARAEVLRAVEKAEALNPTPRGAESPLVEGWWALVYQAPADERDVGRAAATTEGPFLGRLRPLLQALARPGAQRQLLDPVGGRVSNKAEFSLLRGRVQGFLDLRGTCTRSSPSRFDVEFTEAVLRVGVGQATLPLGWVRPQGWVEVTYLDEDFRIGRGDKGSVFIAKREARVPANDPVTPPDPP